MAAIREKYGEHAKVLEVNQMGGKGLARFLSAPQLEVIGMVMSAEEAEQERAQREAETANRRHQQAQAQGAAQPALPQQENPPPVQPPAAQPPAAPAQPAEAQEQDAASRRAGRPGRPVRPGRPGRPERPVRPGREERRAAAQSPAPAPRPLDQPAPTPTPSAQPPKPPVSPQPSESPADDPRMREQDTPLTPSGKETLDGLLNKASFDPDLVNRIASGMDWDRLTKMQLNHGLTEIFGWLRSEYAKLEPTPLATRVAFMGTPGCGKTTALCKRMATDIFVHGKEIQVLKVEGESPNPDDALRVLCDILGAPLYRDPVDLEKVNPDGDLYVDVPGIPLHDTDQWKALAERLDELYVETRVLVINAAYEKESIKEMLSIAKQIGCTHQVFTHLDELTNITKLWHFILNSKMTTLFFSHGQNVTSEFTTDILDYMTSKTFPSYLTH